MEGAAAAFPPRALPGSRFGRREQREPGMEEREMTGEEPDLGYNEGQEQEAYEQEQEQQAGQPDPVQEGDQLDEGAGTA